MINTNDSKNYYEVLEVTPDASHHDITVAYNRAKNTYSSDGNALYSIISPGECEKMLDLVEDAFSIIGSPDKRREYDLARGFNATKTPEEIKDKKNKQELNVKESLADFLNSSTENQTTPTIENHNDDNKFKHTHEHSAKSEAKTTKVQAYQKFGLDYQPNQEMEQKIENCTEFTGNFLRDIREYKNVTIERMADMTRISKTYIRNIEGDEVEKLPAKVYTRGFVYQYAKCLKINPDLAASSYLSHIQNLKNLNDQ